MVKKAQKRLFFLQNLRKAKLESQNLVNFYRGAVEIITNWFYHGPGQDSG